MTRQTRHRRSIPLLSGLCLLLFALTGQAAGEGSADAPRPIRSYAELLRILEEHTTTRFQYGAEAKLLAAPAAADSAAAAPVGRSETNVQVQGVDEEDSVKVDDAGYIYQIHRNQVRIIRGLPPAAPTLVKTLDFDESFQPAGLYVAGRRLVVVGTVWKPEPLEKRAGPIFWGGGFSAAKALVYDTSDQARPRLEREVSIEGGYVDSRRIGQAVYLLARAYPRYYRFEPAERRQARSPADLLPTVSDSAYGFGTETTVPLGKVYYLPEFVEPDYGVVAGFRLDRPERPADVRAYLGTGEVVYASTRNLYLSASHYPFVALGRDIVTPDDTRNAPVRQTTRLFKFALDNGRTRFLAGGEVPGTVLNQFSMDEHGEYFRIATTLDDWTSPQTQSRNNIYVLNDRLDVVGSLTDLAPGERIYAARFIGDRGYLVTYRLVDPLFVIDLSRPTDPKVLGELKIPGYSAYLHPYDENHLIGFGKDAQVVQAGTEGADQFWQGMGAFYQGMKLALFDVSDVGRPRELHSVLIGDRGTESELLWNHKALYFDPERHLFGFPIQIALIPGKTPQTPASEYGQPVFQGALVYEVTPEKGFVRKAALSHLAAGEPPTWENSEGFINRLFRIESGLYTLSERLLRVHDIDTFSEQGELPLPVNGEKIVPLAD
jgi:inhibitor of cysteine peptidase